MGQQSRWHATSASGPLAGLTGAGRPGPARRGAVTDGGDLDGGGDSRRAVTEDRAHWTRLTTANQEKAAPPVLGHRSDHDDDGRRTADGGHGGSSALGGEEEGGEVQKDGVLTLSTYRCSSEAEEG